MAGRRCIYMFASRNLLALERAKDAEREVCREGIGREGRPGRGVVPAAAAARLLPCRGFKVSSIPRKQSGTYTSSWSYFEKKICLYGTGS